MLQRAKSFIHRKKDTGKPKNERSRDVLVLDLEDASHLRRPTPINNEFLRRSKRDLGERKKVHSAEIENVKKLQHEIEVNQEEELMVEHLKKIHLIEHLSPNENNRVRKSSPANSLKMRKDGNGGTKEREEKTKKRGSRSSKCYDLD